jgi:hypothetical protein
VSRRRTSVTRSARSWGIVEARIREQRDQPPPVVTRFVCPICGGRHTRLEHPAPGVHGRSVVELRELRRRAADELVTAVCAGAEADHIQRVAAVITTINSRLKIEA